MGLFDWLTGRRKKAQERPEVEEFGFARPKARPHHYHFAHKVLPARLWHGDSVLGILANAENQEFTVNLWNNFGEQLGPSDRLSPDGLRHSSHWIGDEHLVVLIEMPSALFSPEAQFVAITTSPAIRYLTLEKTSSPTAASGSFLLAEWTADGGHRNFGGAGPPTVTAFLHSLCRLLGLPEAVATPSREQLIGMGRGKQIIDMTPPEELPEDDQRRVEAWEQEAEAALNANNPPRAEDLYRRVLDLRMSRQGPGNTLATLAHAELAQTLMAQGKHREAETLCVTWWKCCRRHRMLGHAETMFCTKVLAEALLSQGKHSEASELMAYRALMGGLARGADSMVANQARSDLENFKRTNGSA